MGGGCGGDTCDEHNPPYKTQLLGSGVINGYSSSDLLNEDKILTIDFTRLMRKIETLLLDAYLHHQPLRNYYCGSPDFITESITFDVKSLAKFAALALYNRLRTIAEIYHPSAFTTRMNQPILVSRKLEFPTFLSNLLSSIGALQINSSTNNAAVFVYATSVVNQYTLRNLLYKRQTAPHEGRYNRIITNLRSCGIGLSTIDYNHLEGAPWTTCRITASNGVGAEGQDGGGGLLNVYATEIPTRYQNDDIVYSLALMDSEPSLNPFENAVVKLTDNGDAANDTQDAAVGDGLAYTCILAKNLSPNEVNSGLRCRLLAATEKRNTDEDA